MKNYKFYALDRREADIVVIIGKVAIISFETFKKKCIYDIYKLREAETILFTGKTPKLFFLINGFLKKYIAKNIKYN